MHIEPRNGIFQRRMNAAGNAGRQSGPERTCLAHWRGHDGPAEDIGEKLPDLGAAAASAGNADAVDGARTHQIFHMMAMVENRALNHRLKQIGAVMP